jgi:hypothetical protein
MSNVAHIFALNILILQPYLVPPSGIRKSHHPLAYRFNTVKK